MRSERPGGRLTQAHQAHWTKPMRMRPGPKPGFRRFKKKPQQLNLWCSLRVTWRMLRPF